MQTIPATAEHRSIPAIDKDIAANKRELLRRERINRLSAASWQAAWDKHPELWQRSRDLYLERGEAQLERDKREHAAAMRAARSVRVNTKRCSACGSRVAA